ncbi:hypothetical protein [Pelomonas aquatica]|uniref:hypothetical protein n=1 Tax=Pelomonas aquatica TaxID=431058 RepID=UPI00227AA5DD|nr:hypothetical protein [Pelomonas aquatica]
MAIEFDDVGARVIVLDRLEPDWNQAFAWQDVLRVCFKDAGLYRSDVLFITVVGRSKPVVVLMEARGAPVLIGELAKRNLFPEKVWRRAFGDTSGGTHCWPPEQ